MLNLLPRPPESPPISCLACPTVRRPSLVHRRSSCRWRASVCNSGELLQSVTCATVLSDSPSRQTPLDSVLRQISGEATRASLRVRPTERLVLLRSQMLPLRRKHSQFSLNVGATIPPLRGQSSASETYRPRLGQIPRGTSYRAPLTWTPDTKSGRCP